MRFSAARQGKAFIATILVIFIVLSSYVLINIRNSNPDMFLTSGLLLAAFALFALYLFLSTGNPDVIVNQEGIFFERGFLGKRVSLKKILDLGRVFVKLKKNEIRIYSGWKIIFFRKCLLVVVDYERASFFKKKMHLAVLDFREFTDEVFKRARSIEINNRTFDIAQKMNLSIGTNVTLKNGMSIRKEKSLLDEFNSDDETLK